MGNLPVTGDAAGEKLTRIVEIFHRAFAAEGVLLRGGFAEPFYQPPLGGSPAEIRFTRDYLNSCLHEVAHWCIAGSARRRQDDYGYWYRPDGRDGEQQLAFFKAEAGPQALECAFAAACGAVFRMSCDNLAGEVRGEAEFATELRGKLRGYLGEGFPPRGARFVEALLAHYRPEVDRSEARAWLGERTRSILAALTGTSGTAESTGNAGSAWEEV